MFLLKERIVTMRLNYYKCDVVLIIENFLSLQQFPTESIFGDLPAPPPTEQPEVKGNVSSSDPLNFDPFGLNDPLPKIETLLTPLIKDEGEY